MGIGSKVNYAAPNIHVGSSRIIHIDLILDDSCIAKLPDGLPLVVV